MSETLIVLPGQDVRKSYVGTQVRAEAGKQRNSLELVTQFGLALHMVLSKGCT